MDRRTFQRLVVWAALAVALLVPARAFAAILPLCEAHETATVDQTAKLSHASFTTALEENIAAETPSSCTPAQNAGDQPILNEKAFEKVAALCDVRGASTIAPPRITPVSDARIDAIHRCEAEHSASPALFPAPKNSAALSFSAVLFDYTVLGTQFIVPPASSRLLPAYPVAIGAARAGVLRDIEHPPR